MVLMLSVSLVQRAATTLGMIVNRNHRDWHTAVAHADVPQATSGNDLAERSHTHGVNLGLAAGLSIGPMRGLATTPLEPLIDSTNPGSRRRGRVRVRDLQLTSAKSL